ncbi:MAG TPA: fibrillarin-like rRNA/tRNA 2'-O-methyltransferase [Candidatus Nanoarchaeia archaeon]|nr:fibrillarin-like rRNA/tRNA 2'-O-methyltransferase [Candidatus Nanoarchaeia archaeon]
MITKSRIFEVYESTDGRRRYLYTQSLVPGKKVYGEKLFTENNVEYRQWDVSKSKLASVILKGASNVGIRQGDSVLYLGSSTGTTVSHVSDMVGTNGIIFAVDIAPRVMRELVFLSQSRKNIVPVLVDSSKTDVLKERVSAIDVLYQDVAQKNQVEIFLKNASMFLKEGGYGLLALKSRSIDVTKQPKRIYKEVLEQLEKHLKVIDYRELDPFQKDHAMFICKK